MVDSRCEARRVAFATSCRGGTRRVRLPPTLSATRDGAPDAVGNARKSFSFLHKASRSLYTVRCEKGIEGAAKSATEERRARRDVLALSAALANGADGVAQSTSHRENTKGINFAPWPYPSPQQVSKVSNLWSIELM